ncbi:MAG: hypothetical protein PHE79_02810 [Eubacteriales bacterium]|nr:hypothetical protein [Eubacteriales bacterium]
MTEAQKPILTDPYIDLVTNSLAVDAMSPVFDSENGEMIGITGINFTLDNVYEMMKTYKLGEERASMSS